MVEIQCPCGRVIRSAKEYKLVFLRRGALEIDILCPNEFCHLKELGYIQFDVSSDGEIKFKRARFYSPFVTWNASRLGFDVASRVLKEHIKVIVREIVDWSKIKNEMLRRGD